MDDWSVTNGSLQVKNEVMSPDRLELILRLRLVSSLLFFREQEGRQDF